jgi:hypothetical protein
LNVFQAFTSRFPSGRSLKFCRLNPVFAERFEQASAVAYPFGCFG